MIAANPVVRFFFWDDQSLKLAAIKHTIKINAAIRFAGKSRTSNGREETNVYEYRDKVLKCIDCGEEFIFSAGEQLFFADKGLRNDPKRCKPCKLKKNERIAANVQAYGQPFPRERVEVAIKCALCGIETTVPFRPTQGRPVYCRDCFLRMRASSHVHPPVP